MSEEVLPGFCSMCMQSDCGTLVEVKDGVVVKVRGNPLSPSNKGKLDLRGLSIIMNLYNPYRVKAPLKRTNPEKGPDVDPRWERISWEEAFDMVAEKLRKIRKDDPRKLVMWEGWGRCEVYIGLIVGPFKDAFGVVNVVGSHGALCSIHFAASLVHGQFPEATFDIDYTNYVIATGRTLGPNVASACGSTRRFIEALERGMKLVVVDPRRSIEASKAYRWIPIRPGTETAFALAIIYVMLYEINKFDEWFVKNRTNGPYLIGPDGYYVRDAKSKKPLIWDPVDGRAKTFDDESIKDYALEGVYNVNGVDAKPAFQLLKEHVKEYTPEWAEKITTVPAETIRTIAREFIEQARIGSTISIDGFDFPYRPAAFTGSGRGSVSHLGGMYFDLAGKIINALVGAIEVPGGITGNRFTGPGPDVLMPNQDGLVTPFLEAEGWRSHLAKYSFKFPPDHVEMREFYPFMHTGPHLTIKSILEPEKYHLPYKVEAFMICGANPIRTVGQRERFIEAFKKVPFIFTLSPFFDEPTMMADVVLAEHTPLETGMVNVCMTQHQTTGSDTRELQRLLYRKPVKPLYDTKHPIEIIIELAERVGILYGKGGLNDAINKWWPLKEEYALDLEKKYGVEELFDRLASSLVGKEGLNELKKKGVATRRVTPGKLGYNYYYHPGNKTRHPIYFEHAKAIADKLRAYLKQYNIGVPGWRNIDEFFAYFQPLPVWIPNKEFDAPPEYDLYAINWKTNFMPFGTGNTAENPWLHEIRVNDPYELRILVNSETAKKKGLKDGDLVCVESRYGKTKGRVKITELIHPEVIGIPALYGSGTIMMNPTAKEGPYFNALLSIDEEVSIDPLHGGIEISPRVRIYKV